jgi:hypothetical protein
MTSKILAGIIAAPGVALSVAEIRDENGPRQYGRRFDWQVVNVQKYL